MSRLKVFLQRIYIVMRLWISDIVTAARTSFLPAYTLKMKKSISKTKICVLAVYQEGQLREDIKHLINTLLVLECECVVINTKNIANFSDKLFEKITYIERPNWGRDFGSYQTGINYVLRHVTPASIERLVILNDSVFYCEAGLRSFLKGALEGPPRPQCSDLRTAGPSVDSLDPCCPATSQTPARGCRGSQRPFFIKTIQFQTTNCAANTARFCTFTNDDGNGFSNF